MARDTRQWNDYRAHIKITEGDPAECHKWYGIALNRLKFLLAHRPGSVTDAMAPSDGVYIRVDTKPNRIYIKVEGGGVFPTVMSPTGTPSAYPSGTVPPYQLYKERRVYKGLEYQIVNDLYAGGQFNTYSPYPTGTVKGGSWHNGKNKALSWNGYYVFYIGDRFVKLPEVYPDYVATACLTSNSVYQAVTGNPTKFPYVLLVVYTNPSKQFKYKAYTVLKDGSFADKLSLTQFYSGTVAGTFTGFLNFSTNSKFLYTWERPTSDQSSVEYLRTVITKHEFSDDLATVTSTVVYNELEMGEYTDENRDGTLTASSVPYTIWARTEGLNCDLFRINTTNLISTSTPTALSYDGYAQYDYELNMCSITPSGDIINEWSYGAYTDSSANSNLTELGPEDGTGFLPLTHFESSSNSTYNHPYIFDYSPKTGTVMIFEYTYTLTQSVDKGYPADGSSFGTGTATDDLQESLVLKIIKGADVVHQETLYTDSYSNPSTFDVEYANVESTYVDDWVPPTYTPLYHRLTSAGLYWKPEAVSATLAFDVFAQQFFSATPNYVATVVFNRKTGAFSLVEEPDIRRVTGHPFSSQVGLTHLKF